VTNYVVEKENLHNEFFRTIPKIIICGLFVSGLAISGFFGLHSRYAPKFKDFLTLSLSLSLS
jgi:energy-converting hydrogenase Eha subunit G